MIAVNMKQVDVAANLSNKEVQVISTALRCLLGNIREDKEPGNYIDASEDMVEIKNTISGLLQGFGKI